MSEVNIAFLRLDQITPLIHIGSVILLISTQISMVIIARYLLTRGKFERKIYKIIIKEFRKYAYAISILLIFVVVSGFILSNGSSDKFADPMIEAMVRTKMVLYLFLLVNFGYIYYKFQLGKKYFLLGAIEITHENFILIFKYFFPLNIFVSFAGVYLGVAIRGF